MKPITVNPMIYPDTTRRILKSLSQLQQVWQSPVIPAAEAPDTPPKDFNFPAGKALIEQMRYVPECFFFECDCPVYNLKKDRIYMPQQQQFPSIEQYYMILFHEIMHSTGHRSRLNRKSMYTKGPENFYYEELVAEIGAAYLSQIAGVYSYYLQDQITYIANVFYPWRYLRKKRDSGNPFIEAQTACEWLLEPQNPILYPPCEEPRAPWYPEP